MIGDHHPDKQIAKAARRSARRAAKAHVVTSSRPGRDEIQL
jgi:hypothetical protein